MAIPWPEWMQAVVVGWVVVMVSEGVRAREFVFAPARRQQGPARQKEEGQAGASGAAAARGSDWTS